MTTEEVAKKLRASRRRERRLEEALNEVLESIGEPDWGFTNGEGRGHAHLTLKEWIRWSKLIDRDLDEVTWAAVERGGA